MPTLTDFYTVHDLQLAESRLSCRVSFNAEHEIFGGHFPQQPVVPGVCTMHLLKKLLEEAVGKPLRLQYAGTVKFLRLITPEVAPDLVLEWKNSDKGYAVTAVLKDGEAAVFKMNAEYAAA